MSESSAALKPSSSFSSLLPLPSLVPADVKSQSPARAEPPAPHTGNTGRTVQGREVVVGVTAPHHRVASRCMLAVSTPVFALAGLAGLYAWASGVDNGNRDDPHTYQVHWRNGLIGAAGLLAGAVPALVAWGRHAWQRRSEANHLRQAGDGQPARELAAVVNHAVADSPLTLAGLHKCIARIETLRGNVTAQACAMALARLGMAVPIEENCCLPGDSSPLAQLGALVDQLSRMQKAGVISLAEFRQALVSLVDHLRAPGHPNEPQADAMARRLLGAYAQATASHGDADAKASGRPVLDDERLWDRADLIVDLCGTRHFQPHALAVQQAGSDLLHCDPRAYRDARPITPQRTPRDAKDQAEGHVNTDRLLHTAPRHLKDEVGRAIHRAMDKSRPAVVQARMLLTILHTIASRRDLPPGAFLEGLLPPETVGNLAEAVSADRSPVPEGVDRAALIAELPRLSQLQGSGRMLERVFQALHRLPQHSYEGQDPAEQDARERALCHWIDVACIAADTRITGTGQDASLPVGSAAWMQALRSPAARLHQHWLGDAHRDELVRLLVPVDSRQNAPAIVIQMSDFLRDKGADDS